MAVHFSSERADWGTPWEFFRELDAEFAFDIDVCATVENAKCGVYFTIADDGLAQAWAPLTCFMNPPYGREIGKWIKKAYDESLLGATVVCLLPSRTDTRWWHDYVVKAEIRFIRGRLKFDGHKNCAPFPSAVAIFRDQTSLL